MSSDDAKQQCARFDHASELQMHNPYPMYENFRNQCPVGRSENYGGFYVAASYAAAKQVFEDYTQFSSSEGVGIPPHPYKMIPIDLDPPQHTKYRRLVNPRFTPEAVAPKQDQIEATIHALIDDIIEKGSADFATDLVRPLLPKIVLPMLGVPYQDQAQLSAWIEYLTRGRANDLAGVAKAGEDIAIYLMGLVARRRGEPEGDDMIGTLLKSSVGGTALSDDEIYRMVLITLFGGLDTTSAVMLESLFFLARNPDEKQKLLSGERDWAVAVEEFVRFTSPIQGLRRTALKDTELQGQALKKGDWVFGLHGSANRDAAVFPEAGKCQLDRTPNPHLGFGAGAHVCLGRNLARLEIRILLKIVLERLGDYRTALADFVPDYLAGEARGMKSLPVTFTPGQRQR